MTGKQRGRKVIAMSLNYAIGIRTAREHAKLSQRALCAAVGVDPSYICVLESGKRKPSVDMVEAIAKACGVQPLDVYHWATFCEDEKRAKKGGSK